MAGEVDNWLDRVMAEWLTYMMKKEKEMTNGAYVVVNQWDDGRMFVHIVLARNAREAASAKQAHLDKTSRQRNNRVVAVSEYPVTSVPFTALKDSQAWASTPLKRVEHTPVPPPPPPKEIQVRGNFGSVADIARSRGGYDSEGGSDYF